MSLLRRVKRIERAAALSGGCRVCFGYGPPPAIWRCDVEPEPPWSVCRACGERAEERVGIVLRGNVPDPFPDAPCRSEPRSVR